MFQVRPDGDHRNQVQESPIWEPEPPDPGVIQEDHSHKVQDEAQVATVFTMSK